MKYARVERERRYLLRDLPDDLPAEFIAITDRYLSGTRMRLRLMESPAGEVVARKFTQKFAAEDAAPGETTITNFYLNEREFEVLCTLAAIKLEKRRYTYHWNDHRFAIDVFQRKLSGLVTAEIEFGDEIAMNEFPQPEFAAADVTTDPFFQGGNLVTLNSRELQAELLKRVGSRVK